MGREFDLAGKVSFIVRGRVFSTQLYVNVIDECTYVRKRYRFVPVVQKGNIYVERGA